MRNTTYAQAILILRGFAQHKYMNAPLTEMVHVRFSRSLVVFIRTCALVEGTSPSAVIRKLLHQATASEGYDPNGA